MSVAGAVGIDLGSQYCVIAAAKTGGVDIITNDLSNRFTPTIVSFGDKQRFIGESGLSKINTNFRNTVNFSTRFLGLTSEYSQIQHETDWVTHKIVGLPDNKLGHEVRYLGENMTFTSERVVGMMLSHAKEICQKAGVDYTDVVISVPSYFTEVERRALLDALIIADIKPARIMNETTASALSYGIYRQNEFTEQPRYIAFADLGHSKFSVAVVKFTKDRLHVVSRTTDRNLGGRDFDRVIMEHFAAQFKRKFNVDPLQNPRSRLKLALAAEKMRKVLSANPDAQIGVDCLYEDFDLSGHLSRNEFIEMTADLQARIFSTCFETLSKSGVDRVEAVEIIGGACRMPIVQRILASAFSVEDVSKTMNQEEAVARGCAVQAAMSSPLFRVREYSVQDINMNPINISINDLPIQSEDHPELLFTGNNIFPVIKTVNLQKNRPFQLSLTYTPSLIRGLDRRVALFRVLGPEEPELYTVKVSIKMNINGVVSAESAIRILDTYEQPDSSTPSGAQPMRKHAKVPLEILSEHQGLNSDEISLYRNEEVRMIDKDRLAGETLDKKNELESFVYEWREKLNSVLREYETQDRIQFILQQLQAAENWLYEEGADTSKSVYTEKLLNLREYTDAILYRFNSYTSFPILMQELDNTISQCAEIVYSPDPKYSLITPEDRQAIILECEEQGSWLSKNKETLKSVRVCNNPPFSVDELVNRTIHLREFTQSIILKSAYAKQPAKPEESKETVNMDMD